MGVALVLGGATHDQEHAALVTSDAYPRYHLSLHDLPSSNSDVCHARVMHHIPYQRRVSEVHSPRMESCRRVINRLTLLAQTMKTSIEANTLSHAG